MGPLCVEETRKPSVRELCGNAVQKTPVTTERRARGCASFWGFYRQESVAVGASRGLITQRSLVQIQPPQQINQGLRERFPGALGAFVRVLSVFLFSGN